MKWIVSLLPVGLLWAGCSTPIADPANAASQASTATFLFNHGELQKHLESRQAELDRLDGIVRSLDQSLLTRIGQLERLKQDLASSRDRTGISAAERSELEQEVVRLQSEAASAYQRVLAAGREEERLTHVDVQTKEEIAEDQKAVGALKAKIPELESQGKALDRAVERTRNLRAAQVLRQNEGN